MLRRALPWVFAALAVPLAVVPGIAIGAGVQGTADELSPVAVLPVSAVAPGPQPSAGSDGATALTVGDLPGPTRLTGTTTARAQDRLALAALLQSKGRTTGADRWVLPVRDATISEGFGVPGPHWSSGYHTGQDFGAATGTAVFAAHAGTVLFAGWAGRYGNLVTIEHADGTQTWYAHLSSILTKPGPVRTDQRIGLVGCTGNCFGSHLHFEVRLGPDLAVNPLLWLSLRGVDVGVANADIADQPRTLPEAATLSPSPVGTAQEPGGPTTGGPGDGTGPRNPLPGAQPLPSGGAGSGGLPEVTLPGDQLPR